MLKTKATETNPSWNTLRCHGQPSANLGDDDKSLKRFSQRKFVGIVCSQESLFLLSKLAAWLEELCMSSSLAWTVVKCDDSRHHDNLQGREHSGPCLPI
mmetsp:Transcript_47771/g.144463  ORF Transcript_47771/g.144463 Transcript_47771/m.144463 type:complete len:99 (-) Transcript_47771:186-482(-)